MAGTDARFGSPVAAPGLGWTFDEVSIPSQEQLATVAAIPATARMRE
ncbi:MAG: hypothetical protein AB7P02_07955 [Alphaproteobacteria bacterium]